MQTSPAIAERRVQVGLRRLRRAVISAGGLGAAEAEALHRMHAGGAQEQLLVGGLDAFGGDLHAEAAAEADDRVDDGRGVGGLLDRRARSCGRS